MPEVLQKARRIMEYKENLLDGLAEVVAKQVEGNALPLLKPIDETHPQLEVVGTAVAKLDVDARAVVEEMMDAQARMDRDAVYQQIEWYKQELKKERERTLVYKELFEKVVEEIEQKDEEIAEKDKVIEQKDEEIDELKKKNIRLEAQLEYAKNNPQTTNIIQEVQINNNTTEMHSGRKVGEINMEEGGTREAVRYVKEKEEVLAPSCKEQRIFGYFVEEKAKEYRYKRTIADLNEELRVGFRAKNGMPAFVNKLIKWNNDGVLAFKGSNIKDIFEELVYCFYDEGELSEEAKNKKYDTFKKACSGWNPK